MEYEDKMHEIGKMIITMTNETIVLPIFKVILNRRWESDLEIMEKEELEYGIAYSDCEDWANGEFNRSLCVEYNIDVPRVIWDLMFEEEWGFEKKEGWWHCRNTGLRNDHIYKEPNYYFNRVKKEDKKHIRKIKEDIEKYTPFRVKYTLYRGN